MFLTETYVYLQEDEKPARNKENKMIQLDQQEFFTSKLLSKSENDISNLKQKPHMHLFQNVKKGSNSHRCSYDADTDSALEEDLIKASETYDILQCEICHLEYTSCHEDKYNVLNNVANEAQASLSSKDVKKLKKSTKRKSNPGQLNDDEKPLFKINLEDYKDWSHKMEEFSADAERLWTLQYKFDKKAYQPKLNKIIIGRGQCNDYPELNNILLFDEVKHFRNTEWRNNWIQCLKSTNRTILKGFGLYPTTNSCLFCFEDRAKEISELVQQSLPMIPKSKTIPTGTELNKPTQKTLKNFNAENGKTNGKSIDKTKINGTDLTNKSQSKSKFENFLGKLHKLDRFSLYADVKDDHKDVDNEDFTII